MGGQISVPFWIFIILVLSLVILVFQYLIYPIVAAHLRARRRIFTEELNPKLQLKLSPFTLMRRHVLADRLANDPAVEAKIEDLAKNEVHCREYLMRESWRMAWDIVPAFDPVFYFGVGHRIARTCLRALYSIQTSFENEDKLSGVGRESAVVFVINHRSNLDYAFANYLTSRRTMLSFGVGEWSRVWPIQPFFRKAGGYFVRRNSNDPLYRLLLKRYVQMATEAGVPHAIFVEGVLSNDGGVNPVKVGLIAYITEDFKPDISRDLVFIPIGLNYDRVIEDVNTVQYNSAHFGSLGKLYVLKQGIRFLLLLMVEVVMRRQKFGIHCSNFGNPISFKTWLEERGVDWKGLNRSQRFELIQELGELLGNRIECLVPATPVSVLCNVWFKEPQLQLSENAARERFFNTAKRLQESGCQLALKNDDLSSSFDHALQICLSRKFLEKNKVGIISHVPEQSALLNYYGNTVSHF